jgi:asparagine synthase (glutamine-hydrolysing)
VAELALALPERLRIGAGGTTKVALRQLCARHFGERHAFAPKQGFSIPVHSWLRHQGKPLMTALLAPERVDALGLLDSAAVTRAVNSHLSGQRAYGWELWGLMVLVSWFEQRVSGPPDVRRLPEPSDLRPVTFAPVMSPLSA